MLAGGVAVALSTDEDSTARVLEPDLPAESRIVIKSTDSIEEGDYLLLRTHGGGDLIVELADRILGTARAVLLRGAQESWKKELRSMVSRTSMKYVLDLLKEIGCTRASYQNLRSWMGVRSLRTNSRDDFKAIQQLIGREVVWEQTWNAMGELDSAHRRAGFQISRMLREAVSDANLEQLVESGIMEFQLEGQDVGSMTAYQVSAVSPVQLEIPESRLGRPIQSEALWLE